MGRAEELFNRIESAGESAIHALIAEFQSENLWLDFKRSADAGGKVRLHVDDRHNLAKAISGFGNSDGGVVVWGVDCRPDRKTGVDLPGNVVPLKDPRAFVSQLESAVASCTAPAHRGVRHHAILLKGTTEGFVITLIPASDHAPHQAIQPTNDPRYYMRVGSSFAAVPHAILSGMFGRRPQPVIDQLWYKPSVTVLPFPPKGGGKGELTLSGTITVTNNGRGIARDLYVTIEVGLPSRGSRLGCPVFASNLWSKHEPGNAVHFISHDGVRLPPGATFHVSDVDVTVRVPLERNYVARISCGCDGAEPRNWDVTVSAAEAAEIYAEAETLSREHKSLATIFSRMLSNT